MTLVIDPCEGRQYTGKYAQSGENGELRDRGVKREEDVVLLAERCQRRKLLEES